MDNIPLTLRLVKGSKLTWEEADNNFIALRNGIQSINTIASTTLLWSYQVPSKQQIFSTPIMFTNYGENTIAFQGWDWYLYVLRARDGALDWTHAFGAEAYGRPQAADVNGDGHPEIFGASHDGMIWCFDYNGGNIWQHSNLYAREGTGTVSTATTSTLTDASKNWAPNSFLRSEGAGYGATITLTEGTGSGQTREIVAVTSTTVTVSPVWTTIPDTTTSYRINPLYASDIYFQHAGSLSQEAGTWYLYVTGFDNQCVKLNATTGNIIWKFSSLENCEPYPLIMDVNGDGALECVFVSTDGYAYCLNATTGAQIWKVMPEQISGTNQLDAFISIGDINNDGTLELLISCRSAKVFIINAKTGLIIGQSPTNSGDAYAGVDNKPCILDPVGGTSAFVYATHSGFIYCCDCTGELLWRTNIGITVNSSIQYGDVLNTGRKVLVVCDMGGCLTILDPLTGNILGTVGLRGGVEGTALISDVDNDGKTEVVVTTLDGWIMCYRLIG